jgi:hypothetical protein
MLSPIKPGARDSVRLYNPLPDRVTRVRENGECVTIEKSFDDCFHGVSVRFNIGM